MTTPPVKVGVASIIVNDQNQILVGVRKNSHGSGTWQLPGGHIEFGEHPLDTAAREVLEETGLVVKGIKISAVTNDVFVKENKHYITLFVWCILGDQTQQPKVMEPEKCDGWWWKTWDELKQIKGESGAGDVMFLPLHGLLEQTEALEHLKPQTAT